MCSSLSPGSSQASTSSADAAAAAAAAASQGSPVPGFPFSLPPPPPFPSAPWAPIPPLPPFSKPNTSGPSGQWCSLAHLSPVWLLFCLCPVSSMPPPPLSLTQLSEEELREMEAEGRRGLEARLQCLQNIHTLLDAAMLNIHHYLSTVTTLA